MPQSPRAPKPPVSSCAAGGMPVDSLAMRRRPRARTRVVPVSQRRGEVNSVAKDVRHPTSADNVLAFMDQASFLWVRASGHVHGIQCTWLYRRDIDLDALRRVHDNLGHGLL